MPFISEEQILKVLIGFNPWWTTSMVPKEFTKPVRRLAFYEANKIFQHPSLRREVILTGPRRVGKTTILYQTIEESLEKASSEQILYVSFDHPMLKLCTIGEMIEVFQKNIAQSKEDLFLFFDEIQYASDWDAWLKMLYDQNPAYKIMATGSASPVLADKMTESGVGRWTQIRIPTLSFYEYIQLMGIQQPELQPDIKPTALSKWSSAGLHSLMVNLQPLQNHFHRYLLVGGFPEMALSNDISFSQKMIREDIVDKVMKRDMVSLYNIRNVTELEKIFLYLCMVSGNIVNQETIAKEIGVSRPTIVKYLEFLEKANLIYLSKQVELKNKKVLKSRPKVYLADPAIRNAVLMLGQDVLADSKEMGMIIETALYKHIYTFYYKDQPEIGYYRSSNSNKEIDVVVSLPPGKILVESKYRGDSTISENDAIVKWADTKDTLSAIVITKNGDDYGKTAHDTRTPIMRIPAFAFFYLLGQAEKEGYKL